MNGALKYINLHLPTGSKESRIITLPVLVFACMGPIVGIGCDDKFKPDTPDTATNTATVNDLRSQALSDSAIMLKWTAPGDEAYGDRAAIYDIRYSSTEMAVSDTWNSCCIIRPLPLPSPANSTDSVVVEGLVPDTRYYFGLKSSYDTANWSGVSNVTSCATEPSDLTPTPPAQ